MDRGITRRRGGGGSKPAAREAVAGVGVGFFAVGECAAGGGVDAGVVGEMHCFEVILVKGWGGGIFRELTA